MTLESVALDMPELRTLLRSPRWPMYTGVLESTAVTGLVISMRALFDEQEQFTVLQALLERE